MFVRKRFRLAGFQFLLVVFFRRSASALRLRYFPLCRVRGGFVALTLVRVGFVFLRLALVACGGFVLFSLYMTARVGVGPVRRWFRVSLILVCVWCRSSARRWFLAPRVLTWLRPMQQSNNRPNLNPNAKRTQTVKANKTTATHATCPNTRCIVLVFR